MPRRPHEKLPIHCYICKVLDVFHETFHPNKTPSLRLRHFDGKVYIWEIGRHLLLKDKPISPDLDEECENLKLEDSNKLVRKWDDGNRHVSLFEITSTTEPTVRDDEDVHCKICRCTAEHHERWTQECAGVVEVDHFSSYRCIWYIGSKAVLKDKIFDAQNGDEETPLNYVRNRTKIPVPSWMRCWHEGHRVLIFMERVPGQTLDEAHLYGSLTKDERAMIDKEVDGYIQELRQLQAPQAGLPNGQQIYNRPFWTPVRRTHWLLPPTHEEAKEDWYQKSLSGVGPSEKAKLDELKDRFPASEPYTFTHGDLDTSNIMVQDGHVTGIIDWEGSGFAPFWWETNFTRYGADYLPGEAEMKWLSEWEEIFLPLHQRGLGPNFRHSVDRTEDPLAPPLFPYPGRIKKMFPPNFYVDMEEETREWEQLPATFTLPEFSVELCKVQ